MARYVVAALLVLLAAYGAIKGFPLLVGPQITVESPTEYATSTDGFILLSGVARYSENLIVNGGNLPIDPEGRFSIELLLPQGGSVLSLTATDRFGRQHTVSRNVYIP